MVPVRHVKTCESLKVVDARSSTSVVISQNVLLLRLDKICYYGHIVSQLPSPWLHS